MSGLIELPEMPTMDITARELVAELIVQQHMDVRQPGEFTHEDYFNAQRATMGDKAKQRESCRMWLRCLVANGSLVVRVHKHVSYFRKQES